METLLGTLKQYQHWLLQIKGCGSIWQLLLRRSQYPYHGSGWNHLMFEVRCMNEKVLTSQYVNVLTDPVNVSTYQCIKFSISKSEHLNIWTCKYLKISTCKCLKSSPYDCLSMLSCRCHNISIWTCEYVNDSKCTCLSILACGCYCIGTQECHNIATCKCLDVSTCDCHNLNMHCVDITAYDVVREPLSLFQIQFLWILLKYSFRNSVLFAYKLYILLAEIYLDKLYNYLVALHLYGNQAADDVRWFQVLLKGKSHPGAQSLFSKWLWNYFHAPIQIIADKMLSQIRKIFWHIQGDSWL